MAGQSQMYSQEVVKATKVAEEMVQPEASSTLGTGGGATDSLIHVLSHMTNRTACF